jgi:hypothetical protein
VLLPGEGGYADATRTWDLAAGSCPPIALVAASAADIAAGARWAKENFYGPSPEPGSILRLWDFADADRIVMVSKNLDPGNRIRTGRPPR